MAIFPHIEIEAIVQENDKIRIKCDKSFVSKDEAAITLVEIEPLAANGFIDVTGSSYKDWYLDWEYATEGTITVSCRVTTDGSPTTITKDLEVISAANDKLFSADSDLVLHKSDVLKYLPDGKSSFLYLHRRAQDRIVRWVDDMGYRDINGDKFTKDDFIDLTEVKDWSTFMVLAMIMDDLSNAVDDVFDRDHMQFKEKAFSASNKAVLRLDYDGDGLQEDGEHINMSSVRMFRR